MAEENERHVGDELADSKEHLQQIQDAAQQSKELREKIQNKRNSNKEKNGEGSNKESSPDSKKTGGKSGAEEAGKAGKNGANSAKEAASAGPQSAAGGASSAIPGMNKLKTALRIARKIANAIRKLIKAIIKLFVSLFTGPTVLSIILVIILSLFPLLILKSMVTELFVQVTKGYFEVYDNIFGFDDVEIDGKIKKWDDLTDEEKRKYCEGKVNAWFGQVANELEKRLVGDAKLLHKFFQFLDDITSDDTAFGGWVNKISNDTYEYVVAHDAMELMEELDKQGVQYDQTSLTAMMVMAELQEKYDTLDHMITSADFDEETNELYQEYINTYTQVNADLFQYEYDNPARNRWTYFEKMMGYQNAYNTFEVYNIPIVIEGADNFVTLDGKTLGTISEDGTKQYLNDSITYNPYGNKIDNLSLSLGSDYQLIAAASYIMACYSASTPYEDQSVANLLTMMNDAFNRTGTWSGDNNRQDIDDLCEYHFKFTEVYMGAIVPRLYQPYLYEVTERQQVSSSTHYLPGNKRTANSALNLKGGGSVIGMEPADTSLYESSKLLVPTGWYDVNYDEIWTQDEELPICLQSLDTTNYGTFYNDSFCIISPDERYNSFNPSPYTGFKVVEEEEEASDSENPDAPETPDTDNVEKANEAITVEDVRSARLGYFIYGSNSEEYKDLVPYSNIDFGREFEQQYQQQQELVSTLSDAEKANYVYRYQFPFTRISTSFADEDESDFENPNNITVNYRRTTPLTADASCNIEFFGLDTMNHAGATYTLDDNGNPVSLETFSQESSNHGVFNGYEAWVYLDDETQSRIAMMPKNYVEGNQQILNDIEAEKVNLNHMTIEQWETDPLGVPTNAYFENKPYLYQAKMRYMISVNVTVIPRYMDFIMDCIGYDPTAPLSRGLTDSDGNEISTTSRKGHVTTQGEVATGTYEAYMTFLGVREEELAGASPQVGTFPVIPYEDMMNILRNCMNADRTKPTMNQLQLVYVACAAAGHVMYQWGGNQPAGLNFDAWQRPIPEDSKDHDARNRQPYEYYGMDCSGFVSWIYKTAYNSEFARFDTAGAIQFSNDCATTDQLRKQIKNGSSHSTSYLGEIFIDKNKLRVGDIAVRRTYNKDQVLSGHVAMYCGEDPDDPSKQLWIEMTRFGEAPDPQQSGIQLFTNSDYGYNRNAVYIATHTMLPESDLPWDDMSPVYMMIPSKRELGHEEAVFQAEVASLNPFDDFSTDKEKKELGLGYDLRGMVIVLDPGHQAHANNDTEPLAPWSSEPKAKVSAGTKGVATGRPEYEVVLEIALMAKQYLEANGATVYLTRSTNDVNISNIERANFAMEHNADVFIRLHCDESEKSTSRGIGVFVCSAGGDDAVRKQREYGGWLGECLSKSTGSEFRGVTATTTYSGLNWCKNIPSFLLEMGFMSNAEEDKLLSDPEYQAKICKGIVKFCLKMKEQAT